MEIQSRSTLGPGTINTTFFCFLKEQSNLLSFLSIEKVDSQYLVDVKKRRNSRSNLLLKVKNGSLHGTGRFGDLATIMIQLHHPKAPTMAGAKNHRCSHCGGARQGKTSWNMLELQHLQSGNLRYPPAYNTYSLGT